ncbi:MAG: heavy metal-associated domain-containing protein [Bacteroidia bacterium]|nr:heavy metal-associated domain-containing protein [Bacteroidia bacterium]
MRNIKRQIALVVFIGMTAMACNQIKDEKRVINKGSNDSLLTINLPDAACENCQRIIEDGLNGENGIKQSILNLKSKDVSIVYDPNLTSAKTIMSVVAKLSYKMPCSKTN